MMRYLISATFVMLLLFALAACRRAATWSDTSPHRSGFLTANGVRLNYLDWGGSGPALVLIHAFTGSPHCYDDLAPALTDCFRVVAYTRRGHGQSEIKGPYDAATLTEDLRALMDGLGITKAHLAGWSMGGNEVTAMAGTHPERVSRIVYIDAAYDWADPAAAAAMKSSPIDMATQASAMRSLDAWLTFRKTVLYPGVGDASALEAEARDLVVVQPDGAVRQRMSDSVTQEIGAAISSDRRDYTKVRAPALAIYAETFFDVRNGDAAQRAKNLAWEQKHLTPFRAASIERVRREIPNVEILKLPGTHVDIVHTCRDQVVAAMRRFLSGSPPQN